MRLKNLTDEKKEKSFMRPRINGQTLYPQRKKTDVERMRELSEKQREKLADECRKIEERQFKADVERAQKKVLSEFQAYIERDIPEPTFSKLRAQFQISDSDETT